MALPPTEPIWMAIASSLSTSMILSGYRVRLHPTQRTFICWSGSSIQRRIAFASIPIRITSVEFTGDLLAAEELEYSVWGCNGPSGGCKSQRRLDLALRSEVVYVSTATETPCTASPGTAAATIYRGGSAEFGTDQLRTFRISPSRVRTTSSRFAAAQSQCSSTPPILNWMLWSHSTGRTFPRQVQSPSPPHSHFLVSPSQESAWPNDASCTDNDGK